MINHLIVWTVIVFWSGFLLATLIFRIQWISVSRNWSQFMFWSSRLEDMLKSKIEKLERVNAILSKTVLSLHEDLKDARCPRSGMPGYKTKVPVKSL